MENVGGVRKDTGHLADMYKDSIDRFFSFGSFTLLIGNWIKMCACIDPIPRRF